MNKLYEYLIGGGGYSRNQHNSTIVIFNPLLNNIQITDKVGGLYV